MIQLSTLTENPKNARAISDEPVGNAEAMREALEALIAYWDWNGFDAMRESRLKDMARAALAVPRRNCDVGTEKEQAERQKAYCRKHYQPDQLGGNCHKCPLKYRRGWSCQLAWAQMPYEAQEGAGT